MPKSCVTPPNEVSRNRGFSEKGKNVDITKTENAENMEKVEKVDASETKKRPFSLLVLLASLLSLGSIAWTTWSMLDLFQVKALVIERMGGISLIGLSAAVTMDIFWSATMIAEYRGQKLPVVWRLKKGEPFAFNALPLLGWIEVLFVAALLGYHGSTLEGEAAAFAAVLPIFTKFTWMLALNGLRDPYDLTDDEKATLAAKKRKSRLTRADADATAEQHEAEMILRRRMHEATLAEERRKAEIEQERVKAEIERDRLEREAKFEAEKSELEGTNQIKAMRQRLNAQLQIETMRTQSDITLERMDAEQDIRIRSPYGYNLVQGQVVQNARPQLSRGAALNDGEDELGDGAFLEGLEELDLSDAERRKADLAARFYAADANEGRLTGKSLPKSVFCKANNNLRAPRLSEATTMFPLEWFVDNNLARWMQ